MQKGVRFRAFIFVIVYFFFGGAVNAGAVGMSKASLSGTYKVAFQEISVDKANTGNSIHETVMAGTATLYFNGAGNCTWNTSEGEYSVSITSPSSVTAEPFVDSGSCTYDVSETGLVTANFGEGDTANFQLSTDGYVLLSGGTDYSVDQYDTTYDNWQDVGVKLGTNMNVGSLNGIYGFRGSEYEFWVNNGWIDDGTWSDKFAVDFNGAGSCTLSTQAYNGYEQGIPSQSSVDVMSGSDPGFACSYTVSPVGQVDVNLGDEIITFWVSGNGNLIIHGQATSSPDDEGGTGMGYYAFQLIGIKKGTTLTASSLNGTFLIVTQGTGYADWAGGAHSKYVFDDKTVATFDGINSCTLVAAGGGFEFFFGSGGEFDSYKNSDPQANCTYTLVSDGTVTINVAGGDTFGARLSADGQMLLTGFWGVSTEPENTDYESAQTFGIKVPSFDLVEKSNHDIVYQMLRRDFSAESGGSYKAYIQLELNGAPTSAQNFIDANIANSSATLVDPVYAPSLYTDNYISANCVSTPCNWEHYSESGVLFKFNTLPLENYTVTLNMTDGQLNTVIPFSEDVTLPIINSATMQSSWQGGDLHLRWTNPTTAPAWNRVTALKVGIYDASGNFVGSIKTAASAQSLILTNAIVQDMKSIGDGTLVSWDIQARLYTGNDSNAQISRSQSLQVDIPAGLDTDADGIPDYLDTDDDNDGFTDMEEVACGSDPASADSFCVKSFPWLMLLTD